jgi:hypothetical protein
MSRRSILCTVGSGALATAIGGLSGCSDSAFDRGDGPPLGLLEPGTISDDRETYPFVMNNISATAPVADSTTLQIPRSASIWATGIAPETVGTAVSVSTSSSAPAWSVAVGSFDASSVKQLDPEGTHAGYTLYNGSIAQIGVRDGRLVATRIVSDAADARETLLRVIDGVENAGTGFENTADSYYLDPLADCTYATVLPGSGWARYFSLGTETTDITLLQEYDGPSVAEFESLEEWESEQRRDVRTYATDVTYSTDTESNSIRLSGTVPTKRVRFGQNVLVG